MSKMPNRGPMKMENKGSGDMKRESGGGRNDRNDKSHSHSRSDSSSRNKHSDRDHEARQNDDQTGHTEVKSSEEKKFTGRCRLFVGNLTSDITEDDFKKLFSSYGEVSEAYVNSSRGFGFIRMDYRQNAEAAKAALDGLQRKGRVLRVRFATHAAALKVKNLHPYVSNELLEQAFTQFGEIERAVVIVDERGKSTGEGLVEFTRKPGAQQALRRINDGVFLFGVDPKPIEVEPLEHKDEEDGLPEKMLTKNEQYKKEREKEPHFAPKGSFEYEFGMRWKQLADMEKKRIETVKQEVEDARIKLEDEMQTALYDFQAEQIRQDLLRQQEELRRLEELRNQDRMRRQQELEMRTMSRRAEEERERQHEERRRQEMMMRQQEMQRRSGGGGSMDMQRNRDDMMGMRDGGGFSGGMGDQSMRGGRGGAPPMQPPPAPPTGMGLDRGGQQGMSMDRGGPDRGPQGMGMERGGPQGMGMDRGRQGMGMERGGPQGMGMERGGQQGMGMDRSGQQGMGMDRGGQSGMSSMERGGQQGPMARMQQGGGGQGGQAGGGANMSGNGSPNINMGGQGGGQMETDAVEQQDEGSAQASSDAPQQTWTDLPAAVQYSQASSTPSQFEDADDEWTTSEPAACQDGQWLPPPEGGGHTGAGAVAEEEQYVTSEDLQGDGHDFQPESGNWTWDGADEGTWKGMGSAVTETSDFSDANAGSENLNQDPHTMSVDGAVLERTSVNERLNASEGVDVMNVSDDGDVMNSNNADSGLDGQWMDVQDDSGEQSSHDAQFFETDQLWDAQNLAHDPSLVESLDGNDAVPEGDVASSENNPPDEQLTEQDDSYPEPDDSLALVPYVPPDSPSSLSSSSSTSSHPPPNHRPGPNVATAATGVPLHQNPLGVGQARFVRIHPMHIAAAVAAQHTQAAAMMHQQTRMAAAAAMQQQAAAAVQHQAAVRHQATAAMAAAAQQRTRAALLHQQLVRSRYMGAPVLVRQPFVPVPRVAAPMRVRMRLRRSVMLTEEINLHQP